MADNEPKQNDHLIPAISGPVLERQFREGGFLKKVIAIGEKAFLPTLLTGTTPSEELRAEGFNGDLIPLPVFDKTVNEYNVRSILRPIESLLLGFSTSQLLTGEKHVAAISLAMYLAAKCVNLTRERDFAGWVKNAKQIFTR